MEEEVFWIRRIKRGETHYFQNLYQKHHRKLFSLCYRFTRNLADAEDQLQEVFLRLLAKIDLFREESSFGTWAYRLAVNHLINFGKRTHKPEDDLHFSDSNGEKTVNPDLAMALEQAIDSLPDGFRKVFILHDREGYRHEEIAEMLGCSPATSRSQLCRARLALREKLKPTMALEAS